MTSATERLDMVKKILTRSVVIICDHLDPNLLLNTMQAKGALTPADVIHIQKAVMVPSEQSKKLLDILMVKPTTSYDIFMDTLLKKGERPDIYESVQAIEKEVGYVRPGTTASAEKQEVGLQTKKDGTTASAEKQEVGLQTKKDDVLKPSHIKAFLQELTPHQLNKVYEELDIPFTEVQKAIARANTNDPDDKAKEVLRDWQMENGKNATPRALLQALKECKYNLARQNLEEKWGIRLH